MKDKQTKPAHKSWPRILAIYLASLVGVVAILFGVYSVSYAKQIYPRVNVAGIALGSLGEAEAKQRLAEGLAKRSIGTTIIVTNDNRSFTIKPEDVTASYDIDESVKRAYTVGRDKDFLTNLTQKLTVPFFGLELPASIRTDEAKFSEALATVVEAVTVTEKDADLVIKNGVVKTSAAVIGNIVDKTRLDRDVRAALGNEKIETVNLKLLSVKPKVDDAAAQVAKQVAEAIMASPITFTDRGQNLTAEASTIGGWLTTKPTKGLLKYSLEVDFNDEQITKYLHATIIKTFEIEPRNARLAFTGGQVQIIESSRDGKSIDREDAKNNLLQLLALRKEVPTPATQTISPSPTGSIAPASPSAAVNLTTVTIKSTVKKPDVSDDNITSLGIKERIAISETDFKGSPNNRQENIRLGTKLFNGIILKPGQQFSAVKSLGNIDEASGFKLELVIKQDQLTPEVGGGLCQVSTTLFRAVINAGLKVDERRNHRFRVSYYETRVPSPDPEDYVSLNAKTLVGLDATIYDPSPDFMFTNDTDHYMLIQSKVEGTRLTFELFGTKDGRKTSIEGPFITSTTAAPTEIQYIDEPNLPTGTTKQKEKAVGGAKTNFKYKVTKDGKTLHSQTYTSSYTSWQAKFYRGTGPAPTPEPTPEPTPTPEATPTPEPTPQ